MPEDARFIRRLLAAFALLLGAGAVLPALAQVEVAPGGVVRWLGGEAERCGMDGSEWPPSEDGCWFAIDLLREAGPVTLSRWVDGARERKTVTVAAYPYDVQRIELKDDSRVNLSPENLKRVQGEQKRIGALWWRRGAPRFRLPLAAPLEQLPKGGRFGSRRIFNGEPRSPHSGADYAAKTGTPILATDDGEVALADDLFFSGNSVFLDHGGGLVSMYFHMNEIHVEPGAQVKRGQVIGTVGSTGRSTGPHLHFGLRWRGARVDPALLLGEPSRVTTFE